MSDLPSRDTVAEALTFAPLTDAEMDPIYDIARAYVHGGRLVDREAIDREAAAKAVQRRIGLGKTPLVMARQYADAALDGVLEISDD